MNHLRSRLITDLDELTDYETRWERIREVSGGPIYASHALSCTWLSVFQGILEPRVLVVEDGRDLAGVVPLCTRRVNRARAPFRTVSFIGQEGIFGFNNYKALIEPGRHDVLDEAVRGMGDIGWSMLKTNYMDDDSGNRKFVEKIRSRWQCQMSPPLTSLVMSLPESGSVMGIFGKTTRKNLRHRMNKLERDHGFSLMRVGREDIERSIDTYVKQHLERWGDGSGSLFTDEINIRFMTRLMKVSMDKGFGFAYELLIDGEVAAQNYGFLDGDTARGYLMGMNQKYAKYSPGIILISCLADDLRDRGIRYLDAGAGDEPYKTHLIGEKRPMIGLQASRGPFARLSQMRISNWLEGSSQC